MANTLAPFGASDMAHVGGSQRTEELAVRWIASSDPTPVFNGDLVMQATPTSSSMLTGGYGPYITQGTSVSGIGTTGSPSVGVFRGCEYYNVSAGRMQFSRFWPGSGAAGTSSATGDIKAFVVNDPQYRFIIQASSGGIVGSSQIGQGFANATLGASAAVSSAAGNIVTGNSGVSLLSSVSTALTATPSALPWRLVDFYSNYAPGLLPGQTPGSGTGQFVNGADNTTVGQWLVVAPLFWEANVS